MTFSNWFLVVLYKAASERLALYEYGIQLLVLRISHPL